ncbi:riboflavin biosynthesis protein PYRR, chloroplastic-like isoform X2 [Apium graveolens]|uniref:riboflavin biosynthesis protein PYRR, chloroplastic-like isoform X2 n=1 Tax=Apium graveolens TaxID=4045 RepID=UPI003D79C0D0
MVAMDTTLSMLRSSNMLPSWLLSLPASLPAELQGVEAGGEYRKAATAYVNMEPGDCHGDSAAVFSFIKGGISSDVVGTRHSSQHLRGSAIRMLRSKGMKDYVCREGTWDSGGIIINSPPVGFEPVTQALELSDFCYEQIISNTW